MTEAAEAVRDGDWRSEDWRDEDLSTEDWSTEGFAEFEKGILC
jgi:hypothetical protein